MFSSCAISPTVPRLPGNCFLRGEFPRLRDEIIPGLIRKLPEIGRSRAFHRMVFSRKSVPKAMALFAEHPELDGLWKLFPEITKEEAKIKSITETGS